MQHCSPPDILDISWVNVGTWRDDAKGPMQVVSGRSASYVLND